ncbi:MAG: glycoside hydrolase family 16 [Chitinophagaceae bacterium]|nr:glycoside hydrolase family 16 [Chitinophagaceae bacterium]
MKALYVIFTLSALLSLQTELFAQNWNLVWSDEFNGNAVGPDWVFETGAGGWGNNELEYYRAENASVSGGNLLLTAKKENYGGASYTSVRMKTQGRKSWKYGKIEARIATPSFNGAWPAFWMLGDNISSVGWPKCGEIDIMEHVNTGNADFGTIHWDNNGHQSYSNSTNVNSGITGFHTYTIIWTDQSIKWLVDGTQYAEANIANGVNGTEEFQKNFFILLNFAIGGQWPGYNIDNNAFPNQMKVDYVRVYQAGSTPPPATGGVTTVYKDCNFGGYAVGLPVGNYAYGDLYARGIANEDISSIKVNSGYEVVLCENDNLTGATLTIPAGENSCLVAQGWNDRTTSLIVRAASGVPAFTRTIQAEDYSAMLGVQKEGTSDAGGGLNVGYIDNNDWMAYNSINFPTSGNYKIEYRVASMYGGNRISLDLNAGSIQLGTTDIPSTGGWQNWTTVSRTVNVNAGTYNLGIFAAIGGFNLNWIRITRIGNARTSSEEAEMVTSSNNISSDGLGLFPNPVENELYINSSEDLTGGYISVVDVMGREVLKESNTFGVLNVSKLESGVYTLSAVSKEGNKTTRRFIKH